jgi:D-serine deaminase-like pyridoxal phosphate-dependent protein
MTDINAFAEIAKSGDIVADLSTPRPIIDEDRLAANILRVQTYMNAHSLNFRPHIKTHKIPALAAAQRAAGAKGINCQKITEAEIFAAAGFQDILITVNILGREKLVRLAALNERIDALSVVADSAVTVDGLSAHFASRKPLTVLVECDTGEDVAASRHRQVLSRSPSGSPDRRVSLSAAC